MYTRFATVECISIVDISSYAVCLCVCKLQTNRSDFYHFGRLFVWLYHEETICFSSLIFTFFWRSIKNWLLHGKYKKLRIHYKIYIYIYCETRMTSKKSSRDNDRAIIWHQKCQANKPLSILRNPVFRDRNDGICKLMAHRNYQLQNSLTIHTKNWATLRNIYTFIFFYISHRSTWNRIKWQMLEGGHTLCCLSFLFRWFTFFFASILFRCSEKNKTRINKYKTQYQQTEATQEFYWTKNRQINANEHNIWKHFTFQRRSKYLELAFSFLDNIFSSVFFSLSHSIFWLSLYFSSFFSFILWVRNSYLPDCA